MSNNTFKPMLAATIKNLDDLVFPLMGFIKYDGIRTIVQRTNVLSRTLKPIPNDYIREQLQNLGCVDPNTIWDGEIIIPGKPFNEVASAVMSKEGAPHFMYVIFDRLDKPTVPYKDRYKACLTIEEPSFRKFFELNYISAARGIPLTSLKEVLEFEEMALNEGYEGIILRDPTKGYKFGRSTLREGGLMKYKRTDDAEGIVLGKEELMHNDNEATINNFGHTERSSHKAELSNSGMLGSLVVRAINGAYVGQTFKVSCGSMTHNERRKYWYEELPATHITFKHAKFRAGVNAPLEPVFKAFRIDL